MNKNYLILLLILLITPFAFAKSYSITSYDLNYALDSSGVVYVSEKQNFELRGCFKELFIERPNTIISDPKGYCQGADCVFEYKTKNTESGNPELILKGNFCDTNVTAFYSYTLINQIVALEEGSQFYYKVYPEKTASSPEVNLNVIFPGNPNETITFIHSKNYDSSITGNILNISKKVNLYEIIEVNILMPKEWFDSNSLYRPHKIYTKNEVINLEQNWGKEYASYTKAKVRKEHSIFEVFMFFLGIPIVFIFLIWLIFGKDISKKKLNYHNIYETELPGPEDPLQAYYLISGKFSSNWFSSAVLYLVYKKQYELVKTKEKTTLSAEQYKLVKTKNAKEVKFPFYVMKLKNFLEKYYPDGVINLKDFKNGYISSKENKPYKDYLGMQEFRSDLIKLENEVKKNLNSWAKRNKYFDKKGVNVATYFLVIYLFYVVIAISLNFLNINSLNIDFINLWFFIIFFILLIFSVIDSLVNNKISIFLTLLFGRFSKAGKLKNLQWSNFEKYITDFSLIKKHPPKHVILWEEYLIYATAFGVAKEVTKALKIAQPEVFSKNKNFSCYSSFGSLGIGYTAQVPGAPHQVVEVSVAVALAVVAVVEELVLVRLCFFFCFINILFINILFLYLIIFIT